MKAIMNVTGSCSPRNASASCLDNKSEAYLICNRISKVRVGQELHARHSDLRYLPLPVISRDPLAVMIVVISISKRPQHTILAAF